MKKPLFVLLALLSASTVPPDVVGARPVMTAQGSATATLTVHAHVVRNCTITATPVDFGNYDPLDATGGMAITCTKGINPTVELDDGANAQGAVRRMSSGTSFLTYELYLDVGRTIVWGAGADAAALTLNPGTIGGSFNAVAFARVPGGQNVAPGDYDDTVTATVIF